MTWQKRLLDLMLLALLAPVCLPLLAGLLIWLWLAQGRPLFHLSERMRSPTCAFQLWKLRSMTVDPGDFGVTGGAKAGRITPCGRWLRASHLDELPQLWNILRGEMSFVGPRPPLRRYVQRHPGLYARVLRSRPGLTGLATLRCHRAEQARLSQITDPAEVERVYCAEFLPRKARLDLIYLRRQSLCLDLWLIWQTLRDLRGLPLPWQKGSKRHE